MEDCEALLDQCWALLGRAYEGSYGVGYRKPEFRIVLSAEQIRALRSYSAGRPGSDQLFIGVEKQEMFGHELREQRRTPYLEAIIGIVPAKATVEKEG